MAEPFSSSTAPSPSSSPPPYHSKPHDYASAYVPDCAGDSPGPSRFAHDARRAHAYAYGDPEAGRARVHLASLEEKKRIWWRNVVVTGLFVLSWYGFATVLSLYNKWMFSPEHYGFGFPLFVTFCHMIVQFTLAAIIRAAFPQFRPDERPKRRDYATKVLPTAVATGVDIGLSNLSLKTITLSLYTMCKSSALIFVLFFAFLFRLEQYSLRLVLVIALISFGVLLMVFNTTAVSVPGVLMVFSASAIGGLRWALTELLMHKHEMGMGNPFATIYWLAPLMALTLGIVSAAIEDWSELFGSPFFEGADAVRTAGIIALPGAVAFSMVASEYFIIQRAGIVPLSIAGIFKEVTTITISAWVFGDQLTELNVVGVAVTVSGIALFSYHKYTRSLAASLKVDTAGEPVPSPTRTHTHDDTSPLLGPATATRSGQSSVRAPSVRHADAGDEPAYSLRPITPASTAMVETGEERAERLRDEFEGWDEGVGPADNDEDEEDEDEDEDEADADEVARRRAERVAHGQAGWNSPAGWNDWWDREI
ncbi:hypothetical protein Q5752_001725 [Cryptotrichosporon argae]